MIQQREFPDWDNLYQERQVETMPWYNPDIDADLEQALIELKIDSGTVLDLGTGPGTQAIALAKKGFWVTGSDISEAAITQADSKAKEEGLDISFIQDDIFKSRLDQEFDFVFDRGCFHVFHPDLRQDYVRIVHSLIKPKGYLFVKCFSHLETREGGPYRFTPEEIKQIFGDRFHVISIHETVYQGTLDPLPKALFSILQRL
ncbi:class I SAM-dependent methyltransferase [Fischerella sp. NIES-3754]|uniref:class I SAM-dependent methyltransferase n=1 Tax=Fischerella sp. NIES-3754 TaxID=1752063 RepID=UPI00071F936E|nr:class I SAM-dependent methyltransferase [Fischerella sp. NIES-3754]BAU06187.1 Thiopurine S-methyltransferase (TPMT) [Fischerella sp. NIES-3754]BCX08476.1 MAG: methyltransferase [Fischerella sp.]